MDLEGCFGTIRAGPLGQKLPRARYVTTGATQMLEKRKENAAAGEQLHAQIEVVEQKRTGLRQRRDEVHVKEEKLKESLVNFAKFLKENDAKCSRSTKKAEKERQIVLQKETEMERLNRDCGALDRRRQKLQRLVQRNALYWHFLEQVLQTAKFEEVRELVGRFETLLVTKTQLCERESQAQEHLDRHRETLQRDQDRQDCLLMHNNNLLSQLQTKLDHIRAEALGWESKWTHIQNTAAKETLLLGQIKTVTLNLFHMTGGEVGEEHGVEIDDTETQLDRIQIFIQKQTNVVNEINPSDNLLN
ncbi:Coiled-coil domain-containing protein 42 [Merluccius polli]|uniref:Coiled-coil domain-containing protein 42 n=1 Tax=Merluccius polli TaxID=89951 RepID=A0AA47MKK8_MERPO|nr:Coiled-coil domain-containing protein 42 [Merluccius polli]